QAKALAQQPLDPVPMHGTPDAPSDAQPQPRMVQPVRRCEDHERPGGGAHLPLVGRLKLASMPQAMPPSEDLAFIWMRHGRNGTAAARRTRLPTFNIFSRGRLPTGARVR